MLISTLHNYDTPLYIYRIYTRSPFARAGEKHHLHLQKRKAHISDTRAAVHKLPCKFNENRPPHVDDRFDNNS